MSRDWLLYLDDLIASAEKIGRLSAGRDLRALQADEAACDAVLFKLPIIGEGIKALPPARRASLPPRQQTGPARLRDLIAHHEFAIDAEIVGDVATNHVPTLLLEARRMRQDADGA